MKKVKIIFSKEQLFRDNCSNEMMMMCNDDFIIELKKFNCYCRLMMYINKNENQFVELFNGDSHEFDYELNVNNLLDEFVSEHGLRYSMQEYIEETKNDFDKYGNYLSNRCQICKYYGLPELLCTNEKSKHYDKYYGDVESCSDFVRAFKSF